MKKVIRDFLLLFSDRRKESGSSEYDLKLLRNFLYLYMSISLLSVGLGFIFQMPYIIVVDVITSLLFALGVFLSYRSVNRLYLSRFTIYSFEIYVFAISMFVLEPVSAGSALVYSPVFIFFIIFPIVASLFGLSVLKHILFVFVQFVLIQQQALVSFFIPDGSSYEIPFHLIVFMMIISVLMQATLFTIWLLRRDRKIHEYERKQISLYKELNDSRLKLFSIISHDLRSPATGILGLSELLMMKEKKDSDTRILSETIHDAAKKQYNLLNSLLLWSRSQINQIKQEREELDMNELVESVVSSHMQWNQLKNIKLETDFGKPARVFADREQINTIVRNFLSNAYKFTPKGGTISLKTRETDQEFLFSIADTGMGMDESELSNVFDESQLFTKEGTEAESGSGIGLKICREFASLNGGRIWAESTPGEGSTFYLSLPVESHVL